MRQTNGAGDGDVHLVTAASPHSEQRRDNCSQMETGEIDG